MFTHSSFSYKTDISFKHHAPEYIYTYYLIWDIIHYNSVFWEARIAMSTLTNQISQVRLIWSLIFPKLWRNLFCFTVFGLSWYDVLSMFSKTERYKVPEKCSSFPLTFSDFTSSCEGGVNQEYMEKWYFGKWSTELQ